jgi:hypothetical protein
MKRVVEGGNVPWRGFLSQRSDNYPCGVKKPGKEEKKKKKKQQITSKQNN